MKIRVFWGFNYPYAKFQINYLFTVYASKRCEDMFSPFMMCVSKDQLFNKI